MTAVACTLVSLCVCLVLASALPAAVRLPLTHDSDDVLAGSDFLSVFMRLRTADRQYDRDSNSVNHNNLLPDKYKLSNIFKYGYAVPTTKDPHTEPTTIMEEITQRTTSEIQTTTFEEEQATVVDPTKETATEKVEEKVIEVRVSSSVARHSHRTVETSTAKSVTEEKHVDENLVTTLVTQEQPTLTAVQRSEFAVEEASLPEPEETSRQDEAKEEEVQGRVQEVSPFQRTGKAPVFEIHYHEPPAALIAQREDGDRVPPLRRKEYPSPTSYHTRVTSATSDSSVKFYREHGRSAAAETVHQPVLSAAPPPPYPPPQEEPSERVYGQPEVNYEVDEAVSVVTNGKAHGVQPPPPPPQPPDNKFGYVVEGRNFRKYRVEERTADGFIVGEYGVVSHDDGSLRGVRYTADSTINPRLIYDTLVKFLSLQ